MKDDGTAIAVLENIRSKLEAMGIEVIIVETDFQLCFHHIKEDDFVIILDAAYSGAVAGSVHSCRLEEAVTAYGETNSQHDISIFDLMRLYSKPLKGFFIGIEIAEAGFGCELSEALKGKLNEICLEVERIICEIVKEEGLKMHDTFLNERIYEALLKLCRENKIVKLNKVNVTVNTDSHISQIRLREHFIERNSNLLGDFTEFIVEKQDIGKLNAVINSIEGEYSDE